MKILDPRTQIADPFAGKADGTLESFDASGTRTWRKCNVERFAPYHGMPGWYIRWSDKPRMEMWESSGGWTFQLREAQS